MLGVRRGVGVRVGQATAAVPPGALKTRQLWFPARGHQKPAVGRRDAPGRLAAAAAAAAASSPSAASATSAATATTTATAAATPTAAATTTATTAGATAAAATAGPAAATATAGGGAGAGVGAMTAIGAVARGLGRRWARCCVARGMRPLPGMGAVADRAAGSRGAPLSVGATNGRRRRWLGGIGERRTVAGGRGGVGRARRGWFRRRLFSRWYRCPYRYGRRWF